MTNEEVLKDRWKHIDEYLNTYLKNYKKVNRKTKDKIQDLFNSLNITYNDLNKPISKALKDKLDRIINEYKENGLLVGYFGYRGRNILNKKNVIYKEMIDIMINGIYIEENKTLDDYNNLLFKSVCEDSYNQGLKDIGNTSISFKLPILYTILNIPLFNMTIDEYLKALAQSNADELYKQTLASIQLDKELNVDNKYFSDIFNKQQNRYISINDDKYSGGITNIVESITNQAYLQAGIDTDTQECKFIAEMDKRTTEMCDTLNNQIFKLNEMNVYQRYSDYDKRIVTYHTQGLVQGENLPPINNHFHWCRSTITYLIDENFEKEYTNITNRWLSKSLVNRNAKVTLPKEGDKFIYKGVEYKIDGNDVQVKYSEEELRIAKWLSKKINKKIEMIPKINKPEGVKTPDYKVGNYYFDLKTITGSSSQTLYHAIYGKELQSMNFIFDISKSPLELDEIMKQVATIYNRPDTNWLDKVIIKKDDYISIYERK